MYIRQTRKEEVEEVVEIINAAADFIASQGSPQWQNGQKPTKETILNDIERKLCINSGRSNCWNSCISLKRGSRLHKNRW